AILWVTTRTLSNDIGKQTEAPISQETHTTSHMPNKETLSWVQIIHAIGILAFLSISMQVVFSSVNSYLPLYMVDHHHISPRWAGIVIGLVAGAGIVGAPLGGGLSDRIGRKQMILLTLLLSGPLLFGVIRSPFGIFLLLALILYGITISARMPTMESLIADVVPVSRRTTVLGIYFFLGMETSGVVTPLVGRFIDVYGLDPVLTSLALGLCIIAAIALIFRKHI
ncbi:MAG: MFS transporter, partial [Thermodesulfobacteriota bacterium]|nr:MFS transporter [Thermodesulfobacteriota bacterium]